MRSTAVRTAAAALSAPAALLLTPATAHAADPGDTIALPVRDALAALPVQDEDRTGYERTKFRHWIEADRDGCSTQAEVLLAEAVTAPEQSAGCQLTGGSWYSPYDDTYFTAARALDIDHLVPLGERDGQRVERVGRQCLGTPVGVRVVGAQPVDHPHPQHEVLVGHPRRKSRGVVEHAPAREQ
ncbi:hypothetical protein ACIA8I_39075 [Streptomyces rishiriensis]|uniref:hypothetical protein n=1 Tax=Streptomyces rishiriensis TaxID=68264 RepID=UPI00379A5BDF